MRSEEEIRKDLIDKLRSQADLLEKGDEDSILSYKKAREYILALENVLELDKFDINLNTFDNTSKEEILEIYKNNNNEILSSIYDSRNQ